LVRRARRLFSCPKARVKIRCKEYREENAVWATPGKGRFPGLASNPDEPAESEGRKAGR